MAENFENLDTNYQRDWVKNKIQKIAVEALNRYVKQEFGRKKLFPFKKMTQKNIRAVSIGGRTRRNLSQN